MDDMNARAAPTVSPRGTHYDRLVFRRIGIPMDMKPFRIAIAVALAAGALAACERDAGGTVGQKLDRAVEKTQRSVAEATEKTRESLHENTPKVEEKLDAAGHKLQAATEHAVEKTKETVRETQDKVTSHTENESRR
jgi:hypothetical protein